MFIELQQVLTRPILYERTPGAFWDDPHISEQMLIAHLDPDTDAASRKHAFIDHSAAWIASLLPTSGQLLDLGCGPGLYTKRFADKGYSVTGMDMSERSIAYAKDHDTKSTYFCQNYLTLDAESQFDAVTLIYCDYGALTADERIRLLRRVCRALKPGGLFMPDVFTPAWLSGQEEETSWENCPHGGFWSSGSHICLTAKYLYGSGICLRRHVVAGENSVRCYNIWDTCFSRETLIDETGPFGFVPAGFYDDVAGSPYTGKTSTLCAVLRKGEQND